MSKHQGSIGPGDASSHPLLAPGVAGRAPMEVDTVTVGKRVGEIADAFLETMLFASPHPDPLAKGLYLDGTSALWASDYHVVDPITDELEGAGRFYEVNPTDAADQAAIFPDVDFGLASGDGGAYKLFLIRRAQLDEVRGLVNLTPKNIFVYTLGACEGGKIRGENTVVGLVGGRWQFLDKRIPSHRGGVPTVRTLPGHWLEALSVIFSAALVERYAWHVAFGFNDGGPRLVVPTNPRGCLDLFRSRDLAAGERRRAALRHWVNSHYRNRSEDPGAVAYVRDHLRGATRFIWNGLDCELMVSAYDLEKDEAFRAQAADWRSARKHNHARLRVKKFA